MRNFFGLSPFVFALALVSLQVGFSQTIRPAREDLSNSTPPVNKNVEAKSLELRESGTSKSRLQMNNPIHSRAVFIENRGQFDEKVKFQVRIGTQTAWLTSEGVVFEATRPAQTTASMPTGSVDSWDPLVPFGSDRAKPESRTIDRFAFSEDFVGGICSKVEGKGPRPGVYNYFQGRDPKEWRTNVRSYAEVIYRDLWPGIDLRIYGNGPDLEQEFMVRPGGDLGSVQIAFRGIEKINVAGDGSLEIDTPFGELRETHPLVYQEIDGIRENVNGRFSLRTSTSYGFKVDSYKPGYALVVDPTLLYSTFLGGSAGDYSWNINGFYFGYTLDEYGAGIAVDASGNAYVAGHTASKDFPTTIGAYEVSGTGGFVTKLNSTGSGLIYSTYLGSSIAAIAVDPTGHAYVTGGGPPQGFPTTPNAYNPQCNSNQDFFVAELNPTGSQLMYSTCFGANQAHPSGIAVDSNGRVFVSGAVSGSVPTTTNAFQNSYRANSSAAFVTVIDTTISGASSLVYSTYLGSSGSSGPGASANCIALDSFGKVYVAGSTTDGFPVTVGAFQTAHKGDNTCYVPCDYNPCAAPRCHDAFVAKLDPLASSGVSSLIYSTYLGGIGDDSANGIAVDAAGDAYVAGTNYYGDLPVTPGAFSTTGTFGYSVPYAFVTKLNPAGSALVYSTYVKKATSGDGSTATAIGLDSFGDAYITGSTSASDFPVTPDAAQPAKGDPTHDFTDGFLTKLNPTGSGLLYSSYLGGSGNDVANAITIDPTGDAYVTGYTESPNFPVSFAFQPVLNPNPLPGSCGRVSGCHGGDAFVTKFPLNGTFRVLGLSIGRGGNVGQVTPTVFGSGFHSGFSASLLGPQIVQATQVTIGPLGQFLYPTFDLTGITPGVYSVSVTSLDGSSQTLSNSFTVEQGGTSNVWLDVVGRSAMRGGIQQLYTIRVGNTGTADRNAFRFWVSFPSFLTYKPLSGSAPSVLGNTGQTSYLAFDVPKVAAGATVSFVLGLTLPDAPGYGHLTFQVQVWKDGR